MKTIYKLFLLALVVYSAAYSQISDITRLPVQNPSQSIKELLSSLLLKVKTILNEFKRADRYEVKFNSTGLASGVYIYQLRVNDFITSKKMVLVR